MKCEYMLTFDFYIMNCVAQWSSFHIERRGWWGGTLVWPYIRLNFHILFSRMVFGQSIGWLTWCWYNVSWGWGFMLVCCILTLWSSCPECVLVQGRPYWCGLVWPRDPKPKEPMLWYSSLFVLFYLSLCTMYCKLSQIVSVNLN